MPYNILQNIRLIITTASFAKTQVVKKSSYDTSINKYADIDEKAINKEGAIGDLEEEKTSELQSLNSLDTSYLLKNKKFKK